MDDHNLFFTGYQKKIKKMLKFEVISFIGRIFSPKIRLSKNKYIQIGCGSNLKANFENIDFYPLKLKDINIKNKVSHDLRYPLSLKNNSFYGDANQSPRSLRGSPSLSTGSVEPSTLAGIGRPSTLWLAGGAEVS